MGKRVMAIQYALLSLGTGVISSSQVHNMFHAMHTCMYSSIYSSVQLRASGRVRARAHTHTRALRPCVYVIRVWDMWARTQNVCSLFSIFRMSQ